ncbi:m serotype precursor [Moniliophthora roreri MCA 2997]|uniref:M serotype n=2 Tax=Moniliophthora roreri TaxID=221103 RepID=V2XX23_MONRO|nr:m serotype precursor [Moniliophthora roreri MCA 2997]KAI3622044.1 m serotype precursor [Moniliophthora roreri]
MASTTQKRPVSSSQISRGATARSATSAPRVSSSRNTRRTPTPSKLATASNGTANESLKEDTERIEQLHVQLQDKEQTISSLSTENDNLVSALHAAEERLNDLYSEQSRSEMELAQRIEVADKLRAQVRELEKEKRDVLRRYNEQTASFDAERQAFYDNEQHLKSRIQSLSQARRKQPEPSIVSAIESEAETEDEEEKNPHVPPETAEQDLNDPEQEPAELTALKLELSTLSTSYSSLQSTVVLLQSQLVDLKRVNHELQEENESYMILLREKTLSGQYDVMKQMAPSSTDSEDEEDDHASLHSAGRSTLDRVDELPEDSLGQELQRSMDLNDSDSLSSHHGRPRQGQGRKRGKSTSHSPGAPRGESLADLPITGPGLDLAAELGRAENKDILASNSMDDRDRSVLNKSKRSKKDSKTSNDAVGIEASTSTSDVDALRSEVKALKDANKALSLYASKILDRIIAQEGFEHVLAVDYDKEPPTPATAVSAKPLPATSKPRPQSIQVPPSSTPVSSPFFSNVPKLTTPSPPAPSAKTQRRSMSFDWKNFSIFSTEKKADPNLRPLTLKPGANPITNARKLDTQEDDEDRKERERLNATMKLMGIQPSPAASPPVIQKSVSSPGPQPASAPSITRRFSLFGSKVTSPPISETSSVHSAHSTSSTPAGAGLGIESAGLTQEALEHAEAENSLAALDAHERSLSAEIAKGSGSGFTEITRRGNRRGRRSIGESAGSGSTVWSAGMSGTGESEE